MIFGLLYCYMSIIIMILNSIACLVFSNPYLLQGIMPNTLINQSPTVKKEKWTKLACDDSFCPICLVTYSLDDYVSILPCDGNHSFHTQCIQLWFDKSNTCPLCK